MALASGAKYHTLTMQRRQRIPARFALAALVALAIVALPKAQDATPETKPAAHPTLVAQVEGETVFLAPFGPPGSKLIRWSEQAGQRHTLAEFPFPRQVIDRPGGGKFVYQVALAGALTLPDAAQFPSTTVVEITSGPVARFLGGTALRGMFRIEQDGKPPVEIVVPVGQSVGGVTIQTTPQGQQVIEVTTGMRLDRVALEPGPGPERDAMLADSGRDATDPSQAVLGLDGKPLMVRLPAGTGHGVRMVAEISGTIRLAEGETVPIQLLQRVVGPAQE